MKALRSLFVAAAAVLWSSKGWAAAATAVTAGATAVATGVDPWPWVIGGFGAAIVYVKKPSSSRPDALINSMISVMIGGIVSPLAAAAVSEYLSPKLANQYALAFILSSIWPWLVPALMTKIKSIDVSNIVRLGKE